MRKFIIAIVALGFLNIATTEANAHWGWFSRARIGCHYHWRPSFYVSRVRSYARCYTPRSYCVPRYYSYGPSCYTRYSYSLPVPSVNYYYGAANVVPSVTLPTQTLYGPQALHRFLGIDRNQRAPLNFVSIDNRNPVVVKKDAGPRISNQAARDRANQFINVGDGLFRQQRFHEALQRYKSAAESAPDIAEAYFRQGHALMATGRFELAAAALKRAMALKPDLNRDGFALGELYRDNRLAKHSHVELLAKNALDNPNDGDAMFLLGVFLRYDGDAQRAQKFFQRAFELGGDDADHLAGFLSNDGDQLALNDRVDL